MNDEELHQEISRGLHQLFPEPTGVSLRVSTARRPGRGPLVAIVAAAAAVLVVVVGVSVGSSMVSGTGGHQSPGPASGPPAASASSVPSWASRCLPQGSQNLGPADEYVGLTRSAAKRLAARRGEQLYFAGAAGHCSDVSDDVIRVKPVAVVYDLPATSQGLPSSARIIAARHATSAWSPATPQGRDK